MNRTTTRIVLIGVALVLLGAAWKHGLLRGPRPVPPPAPGCDAALWNHVYHPGRLEVLEWCKTVEGVIQEIRHEADGDFHILLNVENKSLLNDKNFSRQHGALVVEPVCQKQATQAAAAEACQDYAGPFFTIRVGERVRVKGSYVRDTDHGWMEIHPVTSIAPIP